MLDATSQLHLQEPLRPPLKVLCVMQINCAICDKRSQSAPERYLTISIPVDTEHAKAPPSGCSNVTVKHVTLHEALNTFFENDVEGFCNCKSTVKQIMEIKEEAMVMFIHLKRFNNALQKADHVVCISKALYTLYACHLHAACC